MTDLHVTVDPNRCVGSQMCIHVAPEMFSLNAKGQAQVGSVTSRDAAIEAAEQCPMEAIAVSESGSVIAP